MPGSLTFPARRRMSLDHLSVPSQAPHGAIDWTTPIDRSRRFYCETLTPLYYTRVYAEIGEVHRLRYNQLTGVYSNELIGFLETFVLRRTLDALAARTDLGLPDALAAALQHFRQDEARHADQWTRLNRLSEPEWYGSRDHHILAVPGALLAAASFIASHPLAFPLVFWIQLAQEERSIAISRHFARAAPGEIEPRYVAVYRGHLHDEVRHVQIDWHLIEHLFARRAPLVRRVNAQAFRHIVRSLFLTPAASTARIIRLLVGDFPELAPLERRMLSELRALAENEAYHSMMYSRETTPLTFALFDRFPEFHGMQRHLRAYRPPSRGGQA